MQYMDQTGLSDNDTRRVVQTIPKDIREMLSSNAKVMFLGGGYIREIVAGGNPVDLDIFTDTLVRAQLAADDLIKRRGGEKSGTRKHVSKNAVTVITPNRLPVQFITRWTFDKPHDLVCSFDFTVCQAALWRDGKTSNSEWKTLTHRDFYRDLAGRNLVYTNPVREEEAGGSMLRVIKFVKRGYRIQVTSLGQVMTQVMTRVFNKIYMEQTSLPPEQIVIGLLREVDPLTIIDGFDVVDDHEPVEGEKS